VLHEGKGANPRGQPRENRPEPIEAELRLILPTPGFIRHRLPLVF
jgi:hypothetical protein